MPNNSALQALASQIVEAQDTGSLLSAFSSSGPELTLHDAYEVSWLVHEERLKSGWKTIGRKIGFTNPDMWALFGVTQPVWAFVYDKTYEEVSPVFTSSLNDLAQPKIEPEIVFCMRGAPSVDASGQEVLACIEWMAHGVEMVQCHYPNWQFNSTDAICDSSFHGKLFVGEKKFILPNDSDVSTLLKTCEVSLYKGDELIEVGHGTNVLGSPLHAVVSLLQAIQREGSVYPILPGEIITTGTITKAYSVNRHEKWRTEFAKNDFSGLEVSFV
jgi:2-oxo-3-hexenedioate decarboxylase